MPLEEGCDKETISRNIAKLIKDEGRDKDQAVAIAMERCKDYTPADDPIAIPRPSQTDVHYLLKSVVKDASCDGCRWFTKDYCHIVENNPDDITGAGYCDRHEAKEVEATPPGPDPIPVPAPDDMTVELVPEDSTVGYIAPDSNAKSVWKTLVAKFKGGMKPSNTIIKGADGKRYMFIITSNSYQDRDSETITTKALQEYVNSCWKASDYFKSDNSHLVWHDDRLPVGDIVWADMAGPFLIEVARERGGIVAKTAYDYWEQSVDALGASHRFKYRTVDRDTDGMYHRIIKKETSSLPREAASNLLTFSGVLPMATSRDDYFNKMFGLDNAAELLKEGPEKLAAALEAKGVQHKAADKDPVAETQKAEDTFGTLLLQMIDAQADILKEFDGMKAALTDAEQTRTKEMAQYAESFKALEARNAALEAELKLSPRASIAPATALSGDAKKDAEAEIAAKQLDSYNGLDRYIRQVEGR